MGLGEKRRARVRVLSGGFRVGKSGKKGEEKKKGVGKKVRGLKKGWKRKRGRKR